MFDRAFITLFYTMLASMLTLGLLNLLRANLADVHLGRLRREQARHPATHWRRRRPLMTVIVYTHNDASTLSDCLSRLLASSYRKLQIIIIDNASTDDTPRLARDFIRRYPKRSIRLVSKRQASSPVDAIAGIRRYVRGELVAIISGGSLVRPAALRSAASLLTEPSLQAVLPDTRLATNYRLIGISRHLQVIATVWNKKAGSYITPGLNDRNYAAIYDRALFDRISTPARRAALQSLNCLRKQSAGITYDNECVIDCQNWWVDDQHGPVDWLRNFIVCGELLITGFMIYAALRFGQTDYLLLAWATFSSLLLLAIWSGASGGLRTKLADSLLVPIGYSLHLLDRLRSISLFIKAVRPTRIGLRRTA